MSIFLLLDKAAAARGDGLLPELRALMERSSTQQVSANIVPLDRSLPTSLQHQPSGLRAEAVPAALKTITHSAR
jgi:hypothetical protein